MGGAVLDGESFTNTTLVQTRLPSSRICSRTGQNRLGGEPEWGVWLASRVQTLAQTCWKHWSSCRSPAEPWAGLLTPGAGAGSDLWRLS